MPLPSNHRWIIVGELNIRNPLNVDPRADAYTLADILNQIQLNRLFPCNASGDKIIWVSHQRQSAEFHEYLFHCADKNASDSSYFDFNTQSSRDFQKQPEEGSHCSSHLLIKRSPEPQTRGHIIMFEQIPGISRTNIKRFLCSPFKTQNNQKTWSDNDGNEKFYPPFLEILGYQSNTIRDALAGGVLQDVEFVGFETVSQGLDEDNYIREQSYSSTFKVGSHIPDRATETLFNFFRRKFQQFNSVHQQSKFLIRIKTDAGQTKSTEVDSHNADILGQLFLQNEYVTNFTLPLPQRYPDFHQEMVQKIRNLV